MKKQFVGSAYIRDAMERLSGAPVSFEAMEHRIRAKEFPRPFYNRVERKALGLQDRMWKKSLVDSHFAFYGYTPGRKTLTTRE